VPATPPRSRPGSRDRRAEILAAAYRLIAERGLEGLRFGDVARAAGITNGTLLYYFPSKDALVQGVVGHLAHEFATSQAPLPPAAAADPLARLRAELEDVRRRLRDQPGFAAVLLELQARALRDPRVADQLRQLDAGWRTALVGLIEDGQEAGVFDATLGAADAATALMAIVKGIGVQATTLDAAARDQLFATTADAVERWLAGGRPGPAGAPGGPR
jgi:AcrR family transcriptional regulator